MNDATIIQSLNQVQGVQSVEVHDLKEGWGRSVTAHLDDGAKLTALVWSLEDLSNFVEAVEDHVLEVLTDGPAKILVRYS